MVDLVWIIAGIFVSAIAIALVLGHIHGTFA
jgi:hypothetical protein